MLLFWCYVLLVECRFVGFNDTIALYRSDVPCSFSY